MLPRSTLLPRRAPTTLAAGFLVLAFALAACAPRDPLDTVVKARTLNEYLWWERDELPKLGAELQREVVYAVHNLRTEAPWFKPAKNRDELSDFRHPLCQRINGKTVREVIILGNEALKDYASNKIMLSMRAMEALYSAPQNTSRHRALLKMHEHEIELQKGSIERADARIAELRGRPAPKL